MDFQARQYDPQLGRFLAVDPLADEGGQDIFSPYAAMGNAPESMVDPSGTIFTFGSAGLETSFNALKAENDSRMAAYTKELGSLDLFSANPEVQKRIGQLNALIKMHETFRNQLKAMEESPVEFHISNNHPSNNAAAESFYNFAASRVQFNMGGDNPWQPTLAHELRHGYGYINGELVASKHYPDQLYDMMDEVEANLTGFLFTSTPYRAIDGSYGIEDFRPATKPNGTYPQLAGKEDKLSINTPVSVFQKYYQNRYIDSYSAQNINATVGDIMNIVNSKAQNGRYMFLWGDLLKR